MIVRWQIVSREETQNLKSKLPKLAKLASMRWQDSICIPPAIQIIASNRLKVSPTLTGQTCF
jgi:hypothetical protein